MSKKPQRNQMPIEIYRRLATRADYNAECKAARSIFNALKLNSKQRRKLTAYCCDRGIVKGLTGNEPEVAVFILKAALQELRPTIVCGRVHDYVLASIDADWYVTGIYPTWTGSVTAVISPEGRIMYAVHETELNGVPVPFKASRYTGTSEGELIYLIEQDLQAYVGGEPQEYEQTRIRELFDGSI